MKKHIFLAILATLAAAGFAMADQIILPEYPDPKIPLVDETDGCYAISTAGELLGFAELINTASEEKTAGICAKLTANITLNSNVLKTADGTSNVDENGQYIGIIPFVEWTPIGTKEHPFLGKFNGKGHTIRGLYINDDSKSHVGLFGYVGDVNSSDTIVIDSVKLVDSYLKANSYVGGLVGNSDGNVTMTGDTVNVEVSAISGDVGGFIGYLYNKSLTIKNSKSEATVYALSTPSSEIGGFVGAVIGNAAFKNSAFKGRVVGIESLDGGHRTSNCGGFAGHVSDEETRIENSVSEGEIIGCASIGGFVGYYASSLIIEKSSFKGSVDGYGGNAGGFAGYAGGGGRLSDISKLTIRNSTSVGNVTSNDAKVGGLIGHGEDVLIENSSVKGDVKNTNYSSVVGGLVGDARYLTIKNSWSIGNVESASTDVGGLVGLVEEDAIIENSYSKGNVKSVNPYAGGLVGRAESNLTIRGSFSEGDVQCENYYQAGGLVGLAHSTTIENSYAKGDVSAKSGKAGGLVGELGYESSLSVRNSYYAGKVSASDGSSELGGIVGGLSEKTVVTLDNTFYLSNEGYKSYGDEEFNGVTAVSLEKFADGTVAIAMHDFAAAETDGETVGYDVEGKIWGQNLALETPDVYPTLAADGNGKIIFPIVAELNGGSVKEGVPNGYVYGEQVVFPTPTQEHYDFIGWFTDKSFAKGSEIAGIADTTVGSVSIYAGWCDHLYTIAVKTNDSKKGDVEGGDKYVYGREVKLSALARDGYKFSNWEDDVNAAAERTIIVKGDSTFTANFEEIASSSSKNVIASSSSAEGSSDSGTSSSAKSSSSSAKAKSSSSSAKAKSSSSSAKAESSSSSAKAKSSSSSAKAKSSSSSAKAKSSSSSAKAKSSSSKGKDAVAPVVAIPRFSVVAHQRSVQLIGAPVGARFAIFDMQGRVATAGRVESANFSVPVMRAGNYLVRVNGVTKAVKLK